MRTFEFIIHGRPVSQQARRKQRLKDWISYVRGEAEKYWTAGHTQADGPIRITIAFFFDEVALDADNVVKPIQDALKGLAYEDDSLISDVVCRRRNLRGTFRLDELPGTLTAGFEVGGEFVYVRIDDAPDQETVL
jgi:Holliday junction resolvase RusA-like endonuclease